MDKREIELKKAGVSFAIKSMLVKKLTSLPKGVNEHLMTLRMLTWKDGHVTFINVCASTMKIDDEIKEMFFSLVKKTT